MSRTSRNLSAVTGTPQGYRTVTQYGGNIENFTAEVSGSTFRSAELDFYVDEDSIILEAKLRMKIGRYRSYERDTTSGGGSTSGSSSASSSGASSASSSASGGSCTPTSTGSVAAQNMTACPHHAGHAHISSLDPHTHDVTIAGHIHGIDHNHGITHTHSTPAHVHTQTYDIFEEGTLPGAVSVLLDGVNIDGVIGGPFSGDTVEVGLDGVLTTPGWHTLRFEAASGKGRITPYVIVKSLLLQ